jgi:hypothetical protein
VHVYVVPDKASVGGGGDGNGGGGGSGGGDGGNPGADSRVPTRGDGPGDGPEGGPESSGGGSGEGGIDAKAAFSFVKGFLPKYFSSEWSLAQFKLPDFTKSIVAFGPEPNTLIVASVEGYVSYFPSYGQSD